MAFTLSKRPKVKYSNGEQQLFKLLPQNGRPRTSADLTTTYYGASDMPFHARKIVIGLLSSLIEKTNHNKEPFRICKTPRSGPVAMSFWLEKR